MYTEGSSAMRTTQNWLKTSVYRLRKQGSNEVET